MDKKLTPGFLFLAIFSLLAALWAGWVRLGWAWPVPQMDFVMIHGPLMVVAFLGTLIAVERAVALQQRWMFAGPLLTGLAGLGLIVGLRGFAPVALAVLGSLGFLGMMIVIVRRQTALYTLMMLAGGLAWLTGNLFWLFGFPLFRVVLWWMVFLVLTIAAERLELGRLVRLSRFAERLFVGTALVLLAGCVVAFFALDAGTRLLGLGLLALSLWLLHYDIARRTIHHSGLPRFAAACLLSGYIWLGVGGALALVNGEQKAGFLYDAALHSVFVGFVISMIFGHAPIIFPAILNLPIRYRSGFYAHLALLHVSLLLRIGGDLLGFMPLRLWGGLLNGIAMLLFLAVTFYSVFFTKERNASVDPLVR